MGPSKFYRTGPPCHDGHRDYRVGNGSGRYSVSVNLARLFTGTRLQFQLTSPLARSATPSRRGYDHRMLRSVGYLEKLNRSEPTLTICNRSYRAPLHTGRHWHDECTISRSRLPPDHTSIRSRCPLDIAGACIIGPSAKNRQGGPQRVK